MESSARFLHVGSIVANRIERLVQNEVDRSIKATFTAIMGRMAYQTGERLTAEKIWTSKYELVPNVDTMSIDGPSPLMPDENDRYFIPIPGVFKFS